MTRILIIDDDEQALHTLSNALQNEGYHVFTAQSGQAGLNVVRKQFLDLVILNLVLPKLDGFEACLRLQELGIQSILTLGPGNNDRYVVKALELGADDYLPRPVEVPVLLTKVRTLMRRNGQPMPVKPPSYNDGKLLIDLDSRRVEVQGNPVKLTRTEFRLLSILLRRVGRVVTHEDLIREVWGTEKEVSLGSLKLYIHYLRQKIEDDPKEPYYLLAEWGIGYRLRRSKSEAASQPPAKNGHKPSLPLYRASMAST